MSLGAFNYFRFGLPIPPHLDADVNFRVDYEILRTLPGTTDLVDYIFHSQMPTFENVSSLSFLAPLDPPFLQEFGKVEARIEGGDYLILGLKLRPGVQGYGHQVLCYGFDADAQAALVYDPNFPGREVAITAQRTGNDDVLMLRADSGQTDERYRAMFEQQELFANKVSDRTTYDWPDNTFRNLNFAVRPPLVNTQEGWRWCARCEGMWFALNRTEGVCPAGGSHTQERSLPYRLLMNYRESSGQGGWRWCRNCQGLFYGVPLATGVCPAGGQHDGAASADYTMIYSASGNAGFTQDNWRWCNKCQGMHFASDGVCPAGRAHDASISAPYVMLHSA